MKTDEKETMEPLLTPEDVMKLFKRKKSWLYQKVKANIIPHYKIGGTVRFSEKKLLEWLQKHEIKGCQKI